MTAFDTLGKNIIGQGENAGNQHNLSRLQYFLYLQKEIEPFHPQ